MDTAIFTKSVPPLAALKNPHVLIPIGVILAMEFGLGLLEVFYPDKSAGLQHLESHMKTLAFTYLGMAASLTGGQQPPNTQPSKQ